MAKKTTDEKKNPKAKSDVKETSVKKKNNKADVEYMAPEKGSAEALKGDDGFSAPKYLIISAVLAALGLFMVICYGFPDNCGVVGIWIRNVMFGLFAGAAIPVPIFMMLVSFYLKHDAKNGRPLSRTVSSSVATLMLSMLLHAIFAKSNEAIGALGVFDFGGYFTNGKVLTGGGVIGGFFGSLSMLCVGITGTIIITVLVILICLIFIFGFTPRTFALRIKYAYFKMKEENALKEQEKEEAAAREREDRKRREAALRAQARRRDEEQEREIERMRRDTQAHREKAQELRAANAELRTHGDIDDYIFSDDIDDVGDADAIDNTIEEKPIKTKRASANDEDYEDKLFRGESVAEFWRKNEPDSETTFQGVIRETESDDPDVHIFTDIDENDTGINFKTEDDIYADSFEEEEIPEKISDSIFESPIGEDVDEDDDFIVEEPVAEEPAPMPDDAIRWSQIVRGEVDEDDEDPDSFEVVPTKTAAEDESGEIASAPAPDPLADELRRTMEGARRKMQEGSTPPWEDTDSEEADGEEDHAEEPAEATVEFVPELPKYVFPPLELLKQDPGKKADGADDELRANAEKLVATLRSFNVRAKIVDVSRGPTITRYEIGLEAGTRVRTIMNLVDDISYALATNGVRIEGVIPGKSAIGIEVPNKASETVYLRTLLEDEKFTQSKSKLTTALGKTVSGEHLYLDIAKMPHLLIAGTTGSGKSVCINTMLVSLLYNATPDEVKLVLVDPKKVELNVYNGIPHLLVPVVFDPKKAAGALHWCVTEMERRFDLIESMNVRNLDGYNKAIENDPTKERLPRIVIVIDELADLMMTASNEVETSICRIAQKARAAGMHLIIGTQRPSVDVITGLIKANVPSRIAFTVMSQVDSRTIIDSVGAEKLIGRGDMLYAPVGATKPMRAQGAFVSDAELESIIDFIKGNTQKAEYSGEIMERIEKEAALCGKKGKARDEAEDMGDEEEEEDPKLESAIKLAVESGKISTSLIQRKLSLGYGRAAKLIDAMERKGIVGPPEGQKPREVLITKEQYLEMTMRSEGAAGGGLTRDDFPDDEI